MRDELRDIEALEAYAEERMSSESRDAFEQRLRTEPDLAEELAQYRATRAAIVQYHADERVRALLKRTEANAQHEKTEWWKWAAAAAVIIGLSAAWWFIGHAPSLQELAEEFDVKESPLPVFMSAEDNPHVIMDEAMQAYGSGDFQTAIRKLAVLPPSDTALFFTGLAQAQLGQDPSTTLRTVAEQSDSHYRNKAGYHLLVQALRANNATSAESMWRHQMSVTGHPYHARLVAMGARAGWKR
ncbi:MAG TPA: hypothetical protein PLL57_06575 [Flavobacteriales bacterium]|nr:hypothetical protein [Flavobacteriales bacterium]